MDESKWFSIDLTQVLGIALSAVGIYFGLMLFTRLMGLRSFAKISSHDFAMTVGVGSILASTVLSKSPSLMQGLVAMAMLFVLQALVSMLRRNVKPLKDLIDNEPLVLMAHGEYHWDNIKSANLAKSDIQEVLRKNGLKSKSEVFAVVMETTGDMSVIKQNDVAPDPDLFDDIRDCEVLFTPSGSHN
ncbi:DUF421 domain-containing protein [Psychrobacter sp. YP14]|uniref:DUF421 domain-containing protein n=1 Tax=unclassified Psychrobacter TaxID=196806 RepID=UPI000D7D7661|nr:MULTISPECIES: YetF domain-containing protein [unclassified Psychrobacter]AWT49901.1 DUF421 domain-containing protein [Psychrobacter sp. YP14]